MGRPCGPDTVWVTVYVQRDDQLLENAVNDRRCRRCQAAITEVPRQIEIFVSPSCSKHPTTPARTSWGEFHGSSASPRRPS